MDKRTRILLTDKLNKLLGVSVFCIVILVPHKSIAGERILSFAVSGIIAEILVKVGQRVTAGEPLARLDTEVFSAINEAAKAALLAARLEQTIAEERMVHMQQLYDDVSISKEELQESAVTLVKAKAVFKQSQANFKLAGWNLKQAELISPTSGTIKKVEGYIGLVVDPRSRFTPIVILD